MKLDSVGAAKAFFQALLGAGAIAPGLPPQESSVKGVAFVHANGAQDEGERGLGGLMSGSSASPQAFEQDDVRIPLVDSGENRAAVGRPGHAPDDRSRPVSKIR